MLCFWTPWHHSQALHAHRCPHAEFLSSYTYTQSQECVLTLQNATAEEIRQKLQDAKKALIHTNHRDSALNSSFCMFMSVHGCVPTIVTVCANLVCVVYVQNLVYVCESDTHQPSRQYVQL
jgi:hypothetical protein